MDLKSLVNENQSIKIVPSIEDVLRQGGFITDLDPHTRAWFNQLKKTWSSWKKSTAVQNQLALFFQSATDPYALAISIVIKCEDFKECKPRSLAFCVMEALNNWAVNSNQSPAENLKLPAFQIAIQPKNQHFLNLVVKSYRLTTIKNTILPLVKDMIAAGNYKLAQQCIIAMSLFDDISVEESLFPLVLQDKSCMVDEYLTQCPNQAETFVLYLDRFLDRNINMKEIIYQYIEEHKVANVRWEKLYYKPLGKLIARLCTKFKIPINACKNLSKYRTTGGLRYLINQKYIEKNVSASVWDDLVRDALKNNPDAAVEFIDSLADHDKKEALKWAEHLHLPESSYPTILKDTEAISNQNDIQETENWDESPGTSQEYFKFKLTNDRIIIIDNGEKMYDLLTNKINNCNLIGIDCEWKPSFGAAASRVALIQIATFDTIYLIDTMILNRPEYISFWHLFSKVILENIEMIKVGFGVDHDLREMKSSIVGLNNIKQKAEAFLDLSPLWKCLSSNGLKLPHNNDGGCSLSSLVESCFGLPLTKSEQCSNWEIRPLRSTQIEYAALDAHVLVEVYRALQSMSQQQNINFDEICSDLMLEGKQKSSNKKTRTPEKPTNTYREGPKTVLPTQVKFFVEPKIANLASYLRYCGIDAEIISSTMLWHDIINTAISEERHVLVSKMKHTPTVNFPQESILEVNPGDGKKQLTNVFDYFKILVTKENLCKRCLFCNGAELTTLSFDKFQSMCSSYRDYNNSYSNSNVNNEDCDSTNLDNFLSDSESDDEIYHSARVFSTSVPTCLTNKNVPVQIKETIDWKVLPDELLLLCESCGKIIYQEEFSIRKIVDVVIKVVLNK